MSTYKDMSRACPRRRWYVNRASTTEHEGISIIQRVKESGY
jgi:hypothetical protein